MGWTQDSLRRLFGEQQGVISPWRGFRHGWTIGSVGIDEMALFAEKMLSVRQKTHGSTSTGLRQKAFFWFVVAEGYFASHEPAMTVAFRRVFDSFSLFTRSTFVALSFVFRLFLVRFSIGLR